MRIWRKQGVFEGIPVYGAAWMAPGSGIALPGLGIIVHPASYPEDLHLLRHEFGHILQAKKTGTFMFYFKVGIPSLISAIRSKYGTHLHASHWTETWADDLSKAYFNNKTSL